MKILATLILLGFCGLLGTDILGAPAPIVYPAGQPSGQFHEPLTVTPTQVYSSSPYSPTPTTVNTVAPQSVGNMPYYGGTNAFSVPKPVRANQIGY